MELTHYFETMKGKGVLATADDQGHVDVSVYERPHVVDEDTIAFIMPDRLTHHNLQSNIHAAYFFIEEDPGYKGIRLFLNKVREEEDSELLRSIRRRTYATEKEREETSRFLVFFKVDKMLPLIAPDKER